MGKWISNWCSGRGKNTAQHKQRRLILQRGWGWARNVVSVKNEDDRYKGINTVQGLYGIPLVF